MIDFALPRSLEGVEDGHLPAGLLSEVAPEVPLHLSAARSFVALRAAAALEDLALIPAPGGGYRPSAAQVAYEPTPAPHGLGLALSLQAPSFEVVRWLQASAWRYGWVWTEGAIIYTAGDALRGAVLDFERHGTAAPPAYPTLRVGSKGPLVSYLQRILRSATPTTKVDGLFGPSTEDAVRSLQAAHALLTDGVVGPETWNAVRDAGDALGVVRP